ncbi:MAG: energy transducer TonB [Gallionella sp.]|nr:energy transducer TonB [Gallionella sp.]
MTLPRSFLAEYDTSPLRVRVAVIALVSVLHLLAGGAYLLQPGQPAIVVNEMSVSIAMQQAPVVESLSPEPPKLPPTKVARTAQPAPEPVRREVAETVPQALPLAPPQPPVAAPSEASPTVADTPPDYTASYLDNPRPAYPMVARRMGWEGRVVLNVEVLAEGACGAVNVFRSSGREVLDNAAMSTVKGWRFSPARHAGRAVTQWFKVPINFSLEGSEA